jgi:hypothetical protein
MHIDQFVSDYNENCNLFIWTASAESILEKLHSVCSRITGTAYKFRTAEICRYRAYADSRCDRRGGSCIDRNENACVYIASRFAPVPPCQRIESTCVRHGHTLVLESIRLKRSLT